MEIERYRRSWAPNFYASVQRTAYRYSNLCSTGTRTPLTTGTYSTGAGRRFSRLERFSRAHPGEDTPARRCGGFLVHSTHSTSSDRRSPIEQRQNHRTPAADKPEYVTVSLSPQLQQHLNHELVWQKENGHIPSAINKSIKAIQQCILYSYRYNSKAERHNSATRKKVR